MSTIINEKNEKKKNECKNTDIMLDDEIIKNDQFQIQLTPL